MPLWIPEAYPNSTSNSEKAVAAGLVYRPSGETIRDTFDWEDHPKALGGSLKAEKEAEVLQKWHKRER